MSLSDMPLERKTPVAYPDSVYEIVREEGRGNVLLISNISQHGLSGLGSQRRTAFFTFFGECLINIIIATGIAYRDWQMSLDPYQVMVIQFMGGCFYPPTFGWQLQYSLFECHRSTSCGGNAGCAEAWLHS